MQHDAEAGTASQHAHHLVGGQLYASAPSVPALSLPCIPAAVQLLSQTGYLHSCGGHMKALLWQHIYRAMDLLEESPLTGAAELAVG